MFADEIKNLKILSTYLSLRDSIKTGDLIEFAGASLVSKAIRAVTKQDVNHSALVIAPPDFCGLKHRRILLESLANGIEPNYLSERIVQTHNEGGSVYWSPLLDRFDSERVCVGTWAVDEYLLKKPKYDYGSLCAQLFSRVSADARRYFCSEWVEFCLRASPRLCQIVETLAGGKATRPGEFRRLGVFGDPVWIG